MMPAPLGWHTRQMCRSYARHTFLVTCAILVIASSIDLTFYLSKVLGEAANSQVAWPTLFLVWYLGLRCVDFLAELLPLAAFFGVFWAEIQHTTSNERLVVWLSGRAVYQCVVPVLLFGAAVGFLELALNIYLRPAAVTAQVAAHLGSYGERFDRRPRRDPQWIVAGHDFVQAFVEPGPPPTLRDVRIYKMDQSLRLQSYYHAKVAGPIGDYSWMMIDGRRWTVPTPDNGRTTALAGDEFNEKDGKPFDREKIDLQLSPLWIDNYRVAPRYLTVDIFNALSKVSFFTSAPFATWSHARFSLSLFGLMMPLLAASLSMVLLVSEIRATSLAAIAIAGYFANTVMKMFIVLGEHAYLSPALAAWIPLLLLSLAGVTLIFARKRNIAGALSILRTAPFCF
jgi:lipopolysaccharide export LptBFGC system permease protein LptF